MRTLSIANNKDIHGDLSTLRLNNDINMNNININKQLKDLIAYKCDLTGSIPQNIQFSNLKYFVIHDNRLSCDLPKNLTSSNNETFNIILPSNLFSVKSQVINGWMKDSFFITAYSLYITPFDQIKSLILLILCILFTIFIIVKRNIPFLLQKQKILIIVYYK